MIVNKSDILIDYELPDGTSDGKGMTSNSVTSYLLSDQISIEKSANKTFLQGNEEAIYTVKITNNSDVTINNIVFKDIMTGEANYVAGSVKINSVAYADYDPKQGFTIPSISSKASVNVEYKILSKNGGGSDAIINHANISYDVEDPTQGTMTFEADSNEVTIKYIFVDANIFKSVDKKYVKSGDTLTYTIVVTDTSNYYEEKAFTLQDTMPQGTTYVDGSLKINGTAISGDISQGIEISYYMTSGRATVEFQVTVN